MTDSALPKIIQGIEEFNRKEFFACHETLEDVWRGYEGDDRECIQGIIQIAVAFYHYERLNFVGALKLLTRGHERVSRFTPSCFGFDTNRFVHVISCDIERLRSAAPGTDVQLDIPSIEPIRN